MEKGFEGLEPPSTVLFPVPTQHRAAAPRPWKAGPRIPPCCHPRVPGRWWHPPVRLADVPAVGVELLGRALHPQPQPQAQQRPGARHRARAVSVRPSFCPSRPVPLPRLGLFLLPALGFFLRKRGRRRPDPTSGGAQGRKELGMPPGGDIFGFRCQKNGRPGTQHPPRGRAPTQHLPFTCSIAPQGCFRPCPPPHLRHPSAPSPPAVPPWGPHIPPGHTAGPTLPFEPAGGQGPRPPLATVPPPASPGALCQQMYRKHLFPTQAWPARGGGIHAGSVVLLPTTRRI